MVDHSFVNLCNGNWNEYLRKRERGTVGTGKPPPLVRRCNGTIAGLGYLEVGLDCHLIVPPGQWICSRIIKLLDLDSLLKIR
jgi:hypothetical protein